jgi:superoxide dismutase, Fe-Mn family
MAAFEVPPLKYGYDALQPTIDEQTMKLHHDKHHQAYVDKLNGAVSETNDLQGKSLDEIMGMAGSLPPVVRNNGGGHWNHTFFWEIMGPNGGGEPTGEIATAISGAFGSFDTLKEKFNTAGANQFGSGWAWLVATPGGELTICSTPNQDNPLMDVAPVKGTPLLGNDVWEHAYYLTYNNRRPDYLKAWWNVVNWDKVNEHLAKAKR